MNTSHITRTLANSSTTHRPKTRMLMTYLDENEQRFAKIINMGNREDEEQMLRTIRWASYKGIEIVLRPC